jgi:hypothetical protein
LTAVFAFVLLIVAAGSEATPNTVLDEFNHAAKCRVHTELLPAIMTESPRRQQWGRAVFAYWVARSDQLGIRSGFSAEELPMRYLMIPIKSDMDFINGCIEEAKKGGTKI